MGATCRKELSLEGEVKFGRSALGSALLVVLCVSCCLFGGQGLETGIMYIAADSVSVSCISRVKSFQTMKLGDPVIVLADYGDSCKVGVSHYDAATGDTVLVLGCIKSNLLTYDPSVHMEKQRVSEIDRSMEGHEPQIQPHDTMYIAVDSVEVNPVVCSNTSPMLRLGEAAIIVFAYGDSCTVMVHRFDAATGDTAFVCGDIQSRFLTYDASNNLQRVRDAETSRRMEAERKRSLWPPEIKRLVREGKVRIGMTTAQVEAAWGKPEDIHRTITAWSTHEQWVYGNGLYLYFDDGKLTTIQD